MNSIELCNVTKRYGRGPIILDDVSLAVQPNELVTVLGASGSGKTTLLMIVAGFEEPSAGTVFVKGRASNGIPPQKRNLGVVFQNYALFPYLSVWQNVEFPLKVRGVASHERRALVSKILEVVGLAERAQSRPHQLSGGQQQRAALARALVFEPAALLLDEPLSALDRRLRESLQSEIKEVQQRTGASILYVTHDQDEALRLSDRIAVIAHGRIAQVGTPHDIYRNPVSLFVAGCLGEINALTCTPLEKNSSIVRVRYATGEGRARRPADTNSEHAAAGVVAVRPDDLYFCGDADAAENRIQGVVQEIAFLGSAVRYRIAVGSDDVVVRRPAADAALHDAAPGRAVMLAFREENATFFSLS
ncbi:MAG: ABC transporter ATP-binding protein [Vulcanimicrobiaceae bacterium]